ncbi:TetR/AcrR family transcriptional regulator [Streptomyces indonesiensis]
MPKVSQEYLDARRAEILTAARRCFVRDGFHETSMQDLLAEAGMSSGSVYRYFPSKQDMIIAIAEENLAEVVHEARRQAERRPAAGAARRSPISSRSSGRSTRRTASPPSRC